MMRDPQPPAPALTPDKARALIQTFSRVYSGRDRIERTEERLRVDVADVFRDDDLVVVFAEELSRG